MSQELKKGFAVLLSVKELAQVTGGKDPTPVVTPPPPPGDADGLSG